MNAMHIINDAARLLEMDELYSSPIAINMEEYDHVGTPQYELQDLYNAVPVARDFVLALNLVVAEVATQYLPIHRTIEFKGVGEIQRLSLVDNLSDIPRLKKITNSQGLIVEYTIKNNTYILPKIDDYIVEMEYVPYIDNLTDNFTYFERDLDYSALSYGVCAVLTFKYARYEESEVYQNEYLRKLPKEAKKVETIPKSVNTPARRWI